MSILLDPKAKLNLYPYYEKLRHEAPVHFEEALGSWLILPYDLVRRALGEPGNFSSRYGLEATFQGVIKGDILAGVDPPKHTRLRTHLSKAFTPRVVAQLEPGFYEIVHGLLDRVITSGQMDIVEDLALPFPFMVIAQLLGVSVDDWIHLRTWLSHVQHSAASVARKQAQGDHRAELLGLRHYLMEIVEERRRAPKDDIMSILVHGESGGDRLDEEEILAFATLLLAAGTDTTSNVLAQAVRTLLTHPDQMDRLQSDHSLLPSAVEEVLRYEPPSHFMPRIVMSDMEIGGKKLKNGDWVQLGIGAANRDESVFADPNRFDIAREPNPHLSFGYGIHFCLGAAIARLELRVALSVLLDRCLGLARADDLPLEHGGMPHLNGLKSLRVRFRPGKIQGSSS